MKYLNILFVLFTFVFILREVSAYRQNLTLKYFFTPLLTCCAISVALLSVIMRGPGHYTILILTALVLSLAADTMLMVEEVNLLKNGMIYFIMAHLVYLFAFSEGYSFQTWNIFLIAAIPLLNVFYFRIVRKGAGKLIVPLVIYVVIIDLMGYFAITKLNNGAGIYEISVAGAAVMFWISDFILSINAFVKKIPGSTVYTWLFYAPAQFLFAFSSFTVK